MKLELIYLMITGIYVYHHKRLMQNSNMLYSSEFCITLLVVCVLCILGIALIRSNTKIIQTNMDAQKFDIICSYIKILVVIITLAMLAAFINYAIMRTFIKLLICFMVAKIGIYLHLSK